MGRSAPGGALKQIIHSGKADGHPKSHHCSDAILSSLGDMYAAGGDFTANIDQVGGEGTAAFACQAIHAMLAAGR